MPSSTRRFMSILRSAIVAAFGACLSCAPLSAAGVVINEVMYHPPDDRDDLQYIELHNSGAAPADLSGWSLSKGVKFAFPAGTKLAPGGFTVVCRDRTAFTQQYGKSVPVSGEFSGKLKHGSQKIELADAAGTVVDGLKFTDHAPWPLSADGGSSSLERISPAAPGDSPENWAASKLPAIKAPAGSPGRANHNFATNLPPSVRDVTFTPSAPGKPTEVAATIADADGVASAGVIFQVIDRRADVPAQTLPMTRAGGDARSGTYRATIPAQPDGRLVRFHIKATDAAGSIRLAPHAEEPRPAFSYFVTANTNSASVAFTHILSLTGERQRNVAPARYRSNDGPQAAEPTRGQAAFIYLPPGGGPVETYDFVGLQPRSGGWKVHLHKDQLLQEMSTVNIIYEDEPRWVLSEPLGYELFRRCGVPSSKTGHLRVWMDGRPKGFHLLVEQPNKTFLKRTGHDTAGDYYKLIWYGQGVVGQHEKKTNLRAGHGDLVAAVDALRKKTGEEQWAYIQENFDVDECINYMAVSLCIENWDGFFNNYFTWHAPASGGRWQMFPWDLDKTWGDYDGASAERPWFDMGLTFGMKGDREPKNWDGPRQRHPWGSVPWWRPGGWFSGPLLANPRFREKFLARLKVICETQFTQKEFFPVIDALEKQLQPEVRYRATVRGQDVQAAVAEFAGDMASYRRFVKERRKYLLQELAKAGVK
jgi:hypothetical protein